MNVLHKLKSKLARKRGEKKGGKNDTTQPIDTPQDFDILLGRGKTSFNHVGNRRFRVFIGLHLRRYMDAQSRMEKTLVVNSVVEAIQEAGGRFLKQDGRSLKWFQVNAKMAREKVGHALRDAVAMRLKLATGGGGGVEGGGSTQPGQAAPMMRRASEIAREKARRNSITNISRPNMFALSGPEGQNERFSKSCSDLISNDEDSAVRSSLANSAQKAMLELADELGEDSFGEGGSSELMFDPLHLLEIPTKINSNEIISLVLDPEPIDLPGIPPSSSNSGSGRRLNREPESIPSAPLSDETPKLSNSGRKGMASIHPPPGPPRILGANGSPDYDTNMRKTFDGESAEFSVMSEATNKKWFDLGSGEFSVATVNSEVFDDNGGDDDNGGGADAIDLPKHLMDKVNKALTVLEVSGEVTSRKKQGGGSGMFKRKQNMKKGKLPNSFASDIDLSEDFSIMSLDTRGGGRAEEEFGLKSEEFGLKPEAFVRAAGGSVLKSEEFGMRSEEFTRNNSVNGTTFEFDPHSSLVSAMRMSSADFSVKSKDFDALRDSASQQQMSASIDALRSSGSTEFMTKVAKIAEVGARDSASSNGSNNSGRQGSKQKISWNLDHEELGLPKGLMMDTVLEGATEGFTLDESGNDSLELTLTAATTNLAADAGTSLNVPAALTEAELTELQEDNTTISISECSLKSGDWSNALDSLAT
jgi:hypothetical protein